MLLQLLRLWALAAAVTGASTATSSRHIRATPSCQEFPTNYDYQNSQGHNLQSSRQNCLLSRDTTVEYTICSTPALLTDGHPGPQLYNSTEQDHYYHIVQGETEILFTFSDVVSVQEIEIYYYDDVTGNKSLPRVSVHLVNNGFTIGNELTQSRIATVGPIEPPLEQVGLRRQVIDVNALSKKWVLHVDRIEHQFYLSEVSFFSCSQHPTETTGTQSTTASPGNTPTAMVANTSTTPPEPAPHPTTATADTSTADTTQPQNKPVADTKGSSSDTSMASMLPWLLMGIAMLLFCALLTANIICCLVCVVKRYNVRRYKLKRNPSYLPSPRVISTQNRVFEDHIYDVPAT